MKVNVRGAVYIGFDVSEIKQSHGVELDPSCAQTRASTADGTVASDATRHPSVPITAHYVSPRRMGHLFQDGDSFEPDQRPCSRRASGRNNQVTSPNANKPPAVAIARSPGKTTCVTYQIELVNETSSSARAVIA